MTTITQRSAVISLAAERARRGEPDLFPALSRRQTMKALRGLHPAVRPTRLRRGASRLSVKLAAIWVVCAVVFVIAMLAAYGAALWVVGQIALRWRGA